MKVIKTFALSSISLALLSGCIFEESYDPSSKPIPPLVCEPSTGTPSINRFRMYDHTACSDTRISLKIADKDGNIANVGNSGHQESLNVKTAPAAAASQEPPLHVIISEDAPGLVGLQASEVMDLSIPSTGTEEGQQGVFKFIINALSVPEDGKGVLLAVPKITDDADTELVYFDLTSAMHAYNGFGIPQEVKIATSCFIDEGVDFSNMQVPFSLISESNLEFEISQIALQGNAHNQAHVLRVCESGSETITGDESLLFARAYDEDNKVSREGWAQQRRDHLNTTPSNTNQGEANEGERILFKAADDSIVREAYFQLRVQGGEVTRDISRFVEDGVLSFDVFVEDYKGNPDREFEIYFSAAPDVQISSRNSFKPTPFKLGSQGENTTITIPLKDLLYTQSGGQGDRIDIDLLQNIYGIRFGAIADKDDPSDDLTGIQVVLNNIKLARDTDTDETK